MHGTAAGKRLLTSVEDHHHYLALGCYTHACAGMSVCIVRTGCTCRYVLAVADEPLRACRSLPYRAVAVFIHIIADVFGIVDNCGFAVLQYGKEIVVAYRAE